jgi:hypothetical protein
MEDALNPVDSLRVPLRSSMIRAEKRMSRGGVAPRGGEKAPCGFFRNVLEGWLILPQFSV